MRRFSSLDQVEDHDDFRDSLGKIVGDASRDHQEVGWAAMACLQPKGMCCDDVVPATNAEDVVFGFLARSDPERILEDEFCQLVPFYVDVVVEIAPEREGEGLT